jgi:hypothetical protein
VLSERSSSTVMPGRKRSIFSAAGLESKISPLVSMTSTASAML